MVITESRVMPASARDDNGGVMSRPSFTTNTFSPVHSATNPCMLSKIASSYPDFSASTLARLELMYMPVPLAATGFTVESIRRQDDTFLRTPCLVASSPRYVPHGHTAIETFTGHGSGLSPISP